jgi:hypothetical protein
VILVNAAAWCWNRRHQGAATDRIASLTSAFGLAHVIYRSDRLGSEILLLFSCASSSPPFLDLVWHLDSRRNNGGRSVSAIKLFVGFGVDDHLIRELMRFIEMICRKFKKRMMYRLEDSPN